MYDQAEVVGKSTHPKCMGVHCIMYALRYIDIYTRPAGCVDLHRIRGVNRETLNLYPTNVPVREHQFLSGPRLH